MSDPAVADLGLQEQPSGRYRRRLTDSRREQNRRSQGVWRKKQKRRQDEEIKLRVQEELEKREKKAVDVPCSSAEGEASRALSSTTAINVEYSETLIPEPILSLKVALYYYVPPVPEVDDLRHSWPVPDDVDFKTYVLPPGVKPVTGVSSSLSSSASPFERLSPTTTYYQCSFASRSSTSGISSPYLNHLRLVGESCFGATMSIAQSLGITMQAYINDHPSPFSAASNSNIHNIPIDLRPTAYQLIINHPSYLDCIPFPHFRSMAIYLSSLKRLDHCSLFLDLMHDGMVCWGRERASARFGRGMRDGVAWNKRSWEVRRWFWRKWGWIARMTMDSVINSEDAMCLSGDAEDFEDEDGMLSGSQWWWSLHDDDDAITNPRGGDALNSSDTSRQGLEQEELGIFLSRNHTCNVGVRKPSEAHLLVNWG